ncbi:class I SAM-dependent RNA methyltransferase [Corynebacterium uterequi]|uniref:SAM-dependent methyltransferase, tRNA(Uracil-5)-methyltransferase n=1 Tax=Corynebacterium uterequi TaxID=1072256 RepID=A0A0G3HH56_9CORY|nr:TRAM domain-containing protein [Corynebacterium uterequi]AKK11258.1 SAM-dependent methyltransferase, tRNA(uracil-5)-methyltransferase [Corynebacterium uterequi]
MTPQPDALREGSVLDLRVERMAHGGEGLATGPDGRVVFVRGAYPGDEVRATLTQVKKRFARAVVEEVRSPGDFRGEQSCPAAAHGAGCCDFGDVDPAREAELKRQVLLGQLSRVVDVDALPEVETMSLAPHRGWRTRVRLGVDESGRAGLRRRGSTEVVTDYPCTQVVDGLLDGVVGPSARRFTPGSEVVAVRGADGQRHLVELRKASRGRRAEKIERLVEGPRFVTERVGETQFTFPPTAFWQAHREAPSAYAATVRSWLADTPVDSREPVGWDLYAGVGLFAPAIADALGAQARIEAVDYSPAAAGRDQPGLSGLNLNRHNVRVERAIAGLPAPRVVVLDPPRIGAGDEVIAATAAAEPRRVVHIGCDPSTFARDLASWYQAGYVAERLMLVDAFPGTHHCEVLAQLGPRMTAL